MIFLGVGWGRETCIITDKIIGIASVTFDGLLWDSLLISSCVLHGEWLPHSELREAHLFPSHRLL